MGNFSMTWQFCAWTLTSLFPKFLSPKPQSLLSLLGFFGVSIPSFRACACFHSVLPKWHFGSEGTSNYIIAMRKGGPDPKLSSCLCWYPLKSCPSSGLEPPGFWSLYTGFSADVGESCLQLFWDPIVLTLYLFQAPKSLSTSVPLLWSPGSLSCILCPILEGPGLCEAILGHIHLNSSHIHC